MDTCFSPQALILLGAVSGVAQAVMCALFWGWVRSLTKRAERSEARVDKLEEQRDRTAANFEEALQTGTRLAQLAGARA
jgi:hypothetical protein